MSNIGELVERLVEQGISLGEASEIIALAVAAGAATSAYRKSPGAERQRRYRERKIGVTKRNEGVTPLRSDEASQSVTNRNEIVTRDAVSLSLSSKEDKLDKKKRESRASQLPDDWRPEPPAWQAAVERLGSEQRAEQELTKFKNYALDKGRTSKRWGAAWANWVDRAVEYSGQSPRAGPAKTLSPYQQQRAEMKDILDDMDNFARRGSGSRQADHELLPGDSCERSEGLRGGPGADLIDLSSRGGRARG